MRILPLKGTNDYLPNETRLREYMEQTILNTYRSYGFERIMTPAIEDIENLDKSEGGENLSLLFKVLKRGDKLTNAIKENQPNNLADMGLRYDLTLPLSRFYANNRQNLMLPFKCIQIDRVYRAEKPQKGRLREFIQCDIDMIGSNSINCEIELIDVTAKALLELGLGNFTIKINDRRILKAILLSLGLEDEEILSACIVFDKLDKIGVEGIKEELTDKGFSKESIYRFSEFLNKLPITLTDIEEYCQDKQPIIDLQNMISAIERVAKGRYEIAFDLSLVRGQGYYTGTVFEIKSDDFNSSIAGGGRYDNLISKFTGECVPAVGFSIGFERIYEILCENNFKIPEERKKIAVIYKESYCEALEISEKYQDKYNVTVIEQTKKLGKIISTLKKHCFYGIFICEKSDELEIL